MSFSSLHVDFIQNCQLQWLAGVSMAAFAAGRSSGGGLNEGRGSAGGYRACEGCMCSVHVKTKYQLFTGPDFVFLASEARCAFLRPQTLQ